MFESRFEPTVARLPVECCRMLVVLLEFALLEIMWPCDLSCKLSFCCCWYCSVRDCVVAGRM